MRRHPLREQGVEMLAQIGNCREIEPAQLDLLTNCKVTSAVDVKVCSRMFSRIRPVSFSCVVARPNRRTRPSSDPGGLFHLSPHPIDRRPPPLRPLS
jgi:hypothetical protein